jgi:hypothetical protein
MYSENNRTLKIVGKVLRGITLFIHGMSLLGPGNNLEAYFNEWERLVGKVYYDQLMELI